MTVTRGNVFAIALGLLVIGPAVATSAAFRANAVTAAEEQRKSFVEARAKLAGVKSDYVAPTAIDTGIILLLGAGGMMIMAGLGLAMVGSTMRDEQADNVAQMEEEIEGIAAANTAPEAFSRHDWRRDECL